MVPLEPASRRAYFAGLAVAIGFRLFALGALWTLNLDPLEDWMVRQSWLVQAPLVVAALAAPFVIPFVAGFLAAFFWRRIRWRFDLQDEKNAIYISTAISTALVAFPFFAVLGWWALFPLLLDIPLFYKGLRRGETFWNSRLGRQFLGDFWTRDEDEEQRKHSKTV